MKYVYFSPSKKIQKAVKAIQKYGEVLSIANRVMKKDINLMFDIQDKVNKIENSKYHKPLDYGTTINGVSPKEYNPDEKSPIIEVSDNEFFNTIYKVTFIDGLLPMQLNLPDAIHIEAIGNKVKLQPEPYYFLSDIQIFTGYVTPMGTFFYLKRNSPIIIEPESVEQDGIYLYPHKGKFLAGYKVHIQWEGQYKIKDSSYPSYWRYENGKIETTALETMPKTTNYRDRRFIGSAWKSMGLVFDGEMNLKEKAPKWFIMPDDVLIFVRDITSPLGSIIDYIEKIANFAAGNEDTMSIEYERLKIEVNNMKKKYLSGPGVLMIKPGFFSKPKRVAKIEQ